MRKRTSFAGLFILGILAFVVGHAGESPATTDRVAPAATGGRSAALPRSAPRRYRRPTLEQRVRALSRALSLSPAQETQLRAALVSQQVQVRALLRDSSLPPESRTGALRAISNHTIERIRGFLTEEQRKKYFPAGAPDTPGTSASDQAHVNFWLDAMRKKK